MTRRFLLSVLTLLLVTPAAVAQDGGAITAALRAERAKYPARNLTPSQLGEMLNAAAAQVPGWGLLAKPAGNNCPQPGPRETLVSCDWLVHRTGVGCDVLRDQEGAAEVAGCHLEAADASRFVAPYLVTPAPQPPTPEPPTPTPEPGPVDPGPVPERILLLRIIGLLEDIKAGQAAQNVAIEKAIRDLQAEVAKGIKVRW